MVLAEDQAWLRRKRSSQTLPPSPCSQPMHGRVRVARARGGPAERDTLPLGFQRRYKLTGFEEMRGLVVLKGALTFFDFSAPQSVRILTHFDHFRRFFAARARRVCARRPRCMSRCRSRIEACQAAVSAPLRDMIYHKCLRASPGRWGSERIRLEVVPVASEGGSGRRPRPVSGCFDRFETFDGWEGLDLQNVPFEDFDRSRPRAGRFDPRGRLSL